MVGRSWTKDEQRRNCAAAVACPLAHRDAQASQATAWILFEVPEWFHAGGWRYQVPRRGQNASNLTPYVSGTSRLKMQKIERCV